MADNKWYPGADNVSGSTLGNHVGVIPDRSARKARVAELPKQDPKNAVKISTGTKKLTYVSDLHKIDSGPISGEETVKAWILENEYLKITGVLLGGNLMGFLDKETGKEYLWLNEAGAVGYGAGSNAFPLTRGLFLHGGIRMAAVTAEHGLYYDTDWDLDFEFSKKGDEASLIFSIKDDAKARADLKDELSTGGFSSWSSDNLKNYPVTDAIFSFKVTLRKGEKFLRTECTVENTRGEPVQAEAWMPQTWPISESSQIISHQKKRRIKAGKAAYVADNWVMQAMIKDKYVANDMGLDPDSKLPQYNGSGPYTTKGKEGPKDGWVISYPPSQMGPTKDMILRSKGKLPKPQSEEDQLAGKPVEYFDSWWPPEDVYKMDLDYPLQWPSDQGGILYDYPFMDGNYHAVSFGEYWKDGEGKTREEDGRGIAYVSLEGSRENPRFTKMWSWGNKKMFDRDEANKRDPPLAAGRPLTEYYEPWASAFNSAFFELYQFPPGKSSWEARFVPITGGLTKDKKQHELREVVDDAVVDAVKSLKKK